LPPTASSPQSSDAGAPADPWGCIGQNPSTSSSGHPADFWSTGLSPPAVAEAPCTAQKLPSDPWGTLPSAPVAASQAADFWAPAAVPALTACPDPWGAPAANARAQDAASDPWAVAQMFLEVQYVHSRDAPRSDGKQRLVHQGRDLDNLFTCACSAL
jgi:hypothetical protein